MDTHMRMMSFSNTVKTVRCHLLIDLSLELALKKDVGMKMQEETNATLVGSLSTQSTLLILGAKFVAKLLFKELQDIFSSTSQIYQMNFINGLISSQSKDIGVITQLLQPKHG